MRDHWAKIVNLETSRNQDFKATYLRQVWGSKPTLLLLVSTALAGVITTSSLVLVAAWLLGLGGSLGLALFVLVLLPCAGLIAAWQVRLLVAARARWWMQRRLPHSQCAACAFHLDDLTPEPDGCTVCPECGAAWKLGANADDR